MPFLKVPTQHMKFVLAASKIHRYLHTIALWGDKCISLCIEQYGYSNIVMVHLDKSRI